MEDYSQYSDWLNVTPSCSIRSSVNTTTSTAALNLVFILATSNLENLSPLNAKGLNVVGNGAVSQVERVTLSNSAVSARVPLSSEVIAVKSDRILSQSSQYTAEDFERYLDRISLEVRILTHPLLKAHPNILNIIGYEWEEAGGSSNMSLAVEYSNLGTLRTFLKRNLNVSILQCSDLCMQVAMGLEALHSLKVCHGDIKLDNVLVFPRQNGESWTVKISDFSQAHVINQSEPDGIDVCEFGTPLLIAPELRTLWNSQNRALSIDGALRADIFSCGLLIWEVLKGGDSFFDDDWLIEITTTTTTTTTIEEKELFLGVLPHNRLLHLGLEFLRRLDELDEPFMNIFLKLFNGTLQDEPLERKNAFELTRLGKLHPDTEQPAYCSSGNSSVRMLLAPISTWTGQSSLFEMFDCAIAQDIFLGDLPTAFRKRIVSELKYLAQAANSLNKRSYGDVAITLCECYATGFGVDMDKVEVLHWLREAALAGLQKAEAWYYRLCVMMNLPSKSIPNIERYEKCEQELSYLPTQAYFSARLRYFELQRQRQELAKGQHPVCEETIYYPGSGGKHFPSLPGKQHSYSIATFDPMEFDQLTPLHFAAWTGQDHVIRIILMEDVDINAITPCGRTATYYACLGGHYSTLRLLISQRGSASLGDARGITPLHLCVMFDNQEIPQAVKILLQNQAFVNASMNQSQYWEAHDLELFGKPVDWATLCRNQTLVQVLLENEADVEGIFLAASRYFWEIVDLTMTHLEQREHKYSYPFPFGPVARPFQHWICHGEDHVLSIGRTLDVIEQHGIDFKEYPPDEAGNTILMHAILDNTVEGNFELVQQLVRRGQNVKITDTHGNNALGDAIYRARHNENWAETIDLLIKHYETDELDADYLDQASYLHYAISNDSLIGARALLRKGVNINLPANDNLGYLPIQTCLRPGVSGEMLELLLQWGPDLTLSDRLNSLPLHTALSVFRGSSSQVDKLLKYDNSQDASRTALDYSLTCALRTEGDHLQHHIEALRYLLLQGRICNLINEADCSGITPLIRASACLNPYIITLLLEAGADANQSQETNFGPRVPLQIALAVGQSLWKLYPTDLDLNDGTFRKRRESAMQVATLLLAAMEDCDNNPFCGAMQLHLAMYMGIEDKAKKLIASGADTEAKCKWSGNKGWFRPIDLAYMSYLQDQELANYLKEGFFWCFLSSDYPVGETHRIKNLHFLSAHIAD